MKDKQRKKPTASAHDDDDMLPEYDPELIKSGVRGKYYDRAMRSANAVLLAPDVAKVFRDSQQVNDALRMLMETARKAAAPPARKTTRQRKTA